MQAKPVSWSAKWISDPLFENCQPVDLLHKENKSQEAPEHSPQYLNVHSYFRRMFSLNETPTDTVMRITADDTYRLWINGQLVGEGPPPTYRFAYAFDTYDIQPWLRVGENVVAVDVYYQGLRNRVGCSADFRQGLSAEIVLGDRQVITDENWRVHTSEAYTQQRTTGYKTQFLEDVDASLLPRGWRDTEYDDARWSPAVARPLAEAGYTLEDYRLPPLQCSRMSPQSFKSLGSGRYLADFGEEVVGASGLCIRNAKQGQIVELRHAEELTDAGEARYQMRCSCVYQDTWVLAGEEAEQIQLSDYKGFRYLEILNADEDLQRNDVWVLRRHYPFAWTPESFAADPPLLNDIWRICAAGVRNGCQGVMVDCPTREKGQYLGDAVVTSAAQMVLLGDTRQTRKTLLDFAHSSRICPGLMAVAPGHHMQEIADFSLVYPRMLRAYVAFSGDITLAQRLTPVLTGLTAYFARYLNAQGLLEHVDEKWNLVDWPKNLRDDYDYDRAVAGVNTALNAFYQGCLRDVAWLLEQVGETDQAQQHAAQADRHRQAFMHSPLHNSQTGLYVDALGSEHASLHANALALLFDLVSSRDRANVIDLIRHKRLACGVYMAYYVLSALVEQGEAELACEFMLSRDEHSWHTMLAAGATSCLEAWGPDQKWNTSWCHPWAAAPIPITAHGLMGLQPATPGFAALRFAPQTPTALRRLAIRMPTPNGEIFAQHEWLNDGSLQYRLETPAKMPIEPAFRQPLERVNINGKSMNDLTGDADDVSTMQRLPGGCYDITIQPA